MSSAVFPRQSDILYGAGRGGRTPMTLRSADFESAASASSAIPACMVGTYYIKRLIDLHGLRKLLTGLR